MGGLVTSTKHEEFLEEEFVMLVHGASRLLLLRK
jgi:hypothetical protein